MGLLTTFESKVESTKAEQGDAKKEERVWSFVAWRRHDAQLSLQTEL